MGRLGVQFSSDSNKAGVGGREWKLWRQPRTNHDIIVNLKTIVVFFFFFVLAETLNGSDLWFMCKNEEENKVSRCHFWHVQCLSFLVWVQLSKNTGGKKILF